jgi:hypothetical protein
MSPPEGRFEAGRGAVSNPLSQFARSVSVASLR